VTKKKETQFNVPSPKATISNKRLFSNLRDGSTSAYYNERSKSTAPRQEEEEEDVYHARRKSQAAIMFSYDTKRNNSPSMSSSKRDHKTLSKRRMSSLSSSVGIDNSECVKMTCRKYS
jgi:hypothetical protein